MSNRSKYGIDKKILSNYQLFKLLPGFRDMLVLEYFESSFVDPRQNSRYSAEISPCLK